MKVSGRVGRLVGIVFAVSLGVCGAFSAAACATDDDARGEGGGDSADVAGTPEPDPITTEEWLARFCAPFISLDDAFQHYDVLVAEPPDEPGAAREAYLDLFSHLHAVLEGSSESFGGLGDPPVSDMPPGFSQAMSEATQRAADDVAGLQTRLEEIEPDDAVAMADFMTEMEETQNPIATAFEDLDEYESAELDAAIGGIPECAVLTTEQ
ncbi:hypothetical protein ONR57_05395 [Hoyosella sp. YIM 151337]|uniref:hypothetical protein n=1 Tax=Hoyosella sp. YIM 151337 TaxID=2992742 RepID=UPI002236A27E|nr:hypothetical protein [Hoyosella sp. YIM 151337]MCW4352730.1 hypothetical protein [Hoyosella sp. YIM 151337]